MCLETTKPCWSTWRPLSIVWPPFLLTVKQAALKDPLNERYWYIDHAMGVNYIGTLFRKAIEAAGLDLGNKKISASSALKTYAESKQE